MALTRKTQKKRSQPLSKPKNRSTNGVAEQNIQTFAQHIRELRRRLFWTIAVSMVVGSVVYYYSDFFIKIVMGPIGDQKLIYLTPAGGFSFIFMVTFYVTLMFILPFIMYQIYAFLKPAIPRHTSKLSLLVAVAALVLMVAGATFGYIYAVPAGLNFLNNFADSYVVASITADSYLSFVLGYVLGIGLLFELPLLLLFWHWIHPLTPKGLLNSERFVIVGAFIAAAVLSPSPDILSQTVIAVPIIIVYQLGVIGVLVSIRKAKRLAGQEQAVRKPQAAKPQIVAPVRSGQYKAPAPAVPPSIQVVKPVIQPAKKRPVMSMDGVVSKNVRPNPNSIVRTAKPVVAVERRAVASRNSLNVAPRTKIISDFRPTRHSVIDTGR